MQDYGHSNQKETFPSFQEEADEEYDDEDDEENTSLNKSKNHHANLTTSDANRSF